MEPTTSATTAATTTATASATAITTATIHHPDLVAHWFGPAFASLHPLLQQLHLHGGQLAGPVRVHTGRGLAGWLGRRLARQFGVPIQHPDCHLSVTITHSATAMIWARRFIGPDQSAQDLVTVFTPHGHYPHGYWEESTGAMRFRLGVEIMPCGGWRWRVHSARLRGLPLPVSWLPQSQATKCIEAEGYRFAVRFVMPGLGLLLAYEGLLQALAQSEDQAQTQTHAPGQTQGV